MPSVFYARDSQQFQTFMVRFITLSSNYSCCYFLFIFNDCVLFILVWETKQSSYGQGVVFVFICVWLETSLWTCTITVCFVRHLNHSATKYSAESRHMVFLYSQVSLHCGFYNSKPVHYSCTRSSSML